MNAIPLQRLNFLSSVHKATPRDYVQRVVEHDKAACAEVASQWGEDYWDGGYMGNPAIFPLIYKCDSRDIVIVHINPIERSETPAWVDKVLPFWTCGAIASMLETAVLVSFCTETITWEIFEVASPVRSASRPATYSCDVPCMP